MCGRFDPLGLAKVYVLKTNCMGLLTEPTAAFTTYQTGDSPLEVAFANQSQYVYPDSIDGGHYIWDFGDGSPPLVCGQGYAPCPDVVLHSYPAQGQYTATLTARVCSDTSVAVQQVPVVWTNAGDAPAAAAPLLSITPNPADNVLHIALAAQHNGGGTWHLYDINGRGVKSYALPTTTHKNTTLSIADLPEGLYFWQFYGDDLSQAVQSGKISILR